MNEVVIVSAVRTAVGKAPRGTLPYYAAGRSGGDGDQGRARPGSAAGQGGDRRRDHRLRDAGGRAGDECGEDCEPARGPADHGPRR